MTVHSFLFFLLGFGGGMIVGVILLLSFGWDLIVRFLILVKCRHGGMGHQCTERCGGGTLSRILLSGRGGVK